MQPEVTSPGILDLPVVEGLFFSLAPLRFGNRILAFRAALQMLADAAAGHFAIAKNTSPARLLLPSH